MKLWRAIGSGALVWVLIFVMWSIVMFAPGLRDVGIWQYLVHYIVLIPIALLALWFYYKNGDKINGFLLGVFFLIVGIVLDVIITVPLFINMDYAGYFGNPLLLVGFVELIVISGIYWIWKK